MVPCVSSIMFEFILYDKFYYFNFMPSNSVVKLNNFGNSLPMDFHHIGVSLFFLNYNNHLISLIINQIALLKHKKENTKND